MKPINKSNGRIAVELDLKMKARIAKAVAKLPLGMRTISTWVRKAIENELAREA